MLYAEAIVRVFVLFKTELKKNFLFCSPLNFTTKKKKKVDLCMTFRFYLIDNNKSPIYKVSG